MTQFAFVVSRSKVKVIGGIHVSHTFNVTGDLIDNMVKFATQVGWKEDMVELITKMEGQFTIVSKTDIYQRLI